MHALHKPFAARVVSVRVPLPPPPRNKKGFWKVVDFTGLLAAVRPPTAPLHTAADDL
jgi:hypothetical protein